jgi:hypothetical protein
MSSTATISNVASNIAGGDAKADVKSVKLDSIKSVAARVTANESEFEAYKTQTDAKLAALEAQILTLSQAQVQVVQAPAKKGKGRPKKVAELPEAGDVGPDASAYRVSPDDIDESVCVGRSLKGGDDKRWKPIIYRESQCGKAVVEGSDLCKVCTARQEKYAADSSKPGDWNGRINEEPDAWVHMLGTAWAEEKAPKFSGDSTSVASGSESGSVKEMTPAKAKAAEKAAEKAAAKAAEKAEKEAAKAAEKAAKAAEKEAKAAEKAAEKAAKTKKPADKPKTEKSKAKAKPESKQAEAPVATVDGEIRLVDGTLYMVKKGNVYEWDEMNEKAGVFVGRLKEDDTIDTDADEISTAESDSE